MGTGRAFHKTGPDIEKALDPVLFLKRGTTNLLEFEESKYFENFGRSSKLCRCAGWLSSRSRNLLCIF